MFGQIQEFMDNDLRSLRQAYLMERREQDQAAREEFRKAREQAREQDQAVRQALEAEGYWRPQRRRWRRRRMSDPGPTTLPPAPTGKPLDISELTLST
jgi:hypothetical protein